VNSKEELRLQRAYTIVANKHPEANDSRMLELLTRDYLRRQQRIKGVLLFLLASTSAIVAPMLENMAHPLVSLVALLIRIVGLILMIVGICMVVKTFRDPMTPNEAKELNAPKAAEENDDTPTKNKSRRAAYEQRRYDKASPFGRFLILLQRIPFSVYCLILGLLIVGIIHTAGGIHNIITYEERNKNAVEVTAYVSRIESSCDNNGRWRHKIHWTYTYNNYKYLHYKSSRTLSVRVGDTDTFLIDSVHPDTIIVNNAASELSFGLPAVAVALFILLFSLSRVKQAESNFSIFSLFWIPFLVAAIGIEILGIFLIREGQTAFGIVMSAVFAPILLFWTRFFYKVLNHNPDSIKEE
jgi:hypothetical protein